MPFHTAIDQTAKVQSLPYAYIREGGTLACGWLAGGWPHHAAWSLLLPLARWPLHSAAHFRASTPGSQAAKTRLWAAAPAHAEAAPLASHAPARAMRAPTGPAPPSIVAALEDWCQGSHPHPLSPRQAGVGWSHHLMATACKPPARLRSLSSSPASIHEHRGTRRRAGRGRPSPPQRVPNMRLPPATQTLSRLPRLGPRP